MQTNSRSKYTATEILQIINDCPMNKEMYLETYRFIKEAAIKEEEKEHLYEDDDYNLFIEVCRELLR